MAAVGDHAVWLEVATYLLRHKNSTDATKSGSFTVFFSLHNFKNRTLTIPKLKPTPIYVLPSPVHGVHLWCSFIQHLDGMWPCRESAISRVRTIEHVGLRMRCSAEVGVRSLGTSIRRRSPNPPTFPPTNAADRSPRAVWFWVRVRCQLTPADHGTRGAHADAWPDDSHLLITLTNVQP